MPLFFCSGAGYQLQDFYGGFAISAPSLASWPNRQLQQPRCAHGSERCECGPAARERGDCCGRRPRDPIPGASASWLAEQRTRRRTHLPRSWNAALETQPGRPRTAGELSRTAFHFGEACKSRSTRRWSASSSEMDSCARRLKRDRHWPCNTPKRAVPHLPRAPTSGQTRCRLVEFGLEFGGRFDPQAVASSPALWARTPICAQEERWSPRLSRRSPQRHARESAEVRAAACAATALNLRSPALRMRFKVCLSAFRSQA